MITAFREIKTWSPSVEYFQQLRNGTVLAHVVTNQPYRDFNTVEEVEAKINNGFNSDLPVDNLVFGGTSIVIMFTPDENVFDLQQVRFKDIKPNLHQLGG